MVGMALCVSYDINPSGAWSRRRVIPDTSGVKPGFQAGADVLIGAKFKSA